MGPRRKSRSSVAAGKFIDDDVIIRYMLQKARGFRISRRPI
jgi:hypothetical protein